MSTSIARAVKKYVEKHPVVLIEEPPDVDAMRVIGAIMVFNPVISIEDDRDCENCENCSVYLAGRCDSIFQAFCCTDSR